jgi:LmbE family N-acetylglucosaminyl deacetylase
MMALKLGAAGSRLSILCLGAHSDDIEIGAGGTLLSWIAQGLQLDVNWCVLSASSNRRIEAESAAHDFLEGANSRSVEVMAFRDGSFPAQYDDIKAWFEELKPRVKPDVILTHRRDDRHQDHREVCQHTWSTFRNHTILEYEIPKWDGDIGQPNVYMPLQRKVLERKIELLMAHFGTQRSKAWFDDEVFRGLARLRGMECVASDGYAEAFVGRKLALVATP